MSCSASQNTTTTGSCITEHQRINKCKAQEVTINARIIRVIETRHETDSAKIFIPGLAVVCEALEVHQKRSLYLDQLSQLFLRWVALAKSHHSPRLLPDSTSSRGTSIPLRRTDKGSAGYTLLLLGSVLSFVTSGSASCPHLVIASSPTLAMSFAP